jgi:hypothetical protein
VSRGAVAVLILAGVFAAVTVGVLAKGSVRLGGDSPRYIDGADNLLAGRPLGRQQASHLGYLAVVALFRRTGLGLPGVVAFQVAAAAAAAVAMYDLGRRLHGPAAGVLAAGFFVGNPDIALWQAYVLTDSLYISAVILAAWSTDWAADGRGLRYPAAAGLVAFAVALRPNGWFLLPIVGIYWAARRWVGPLRWSAWALILLIGLAAFAPVAHSRMDHTRRLTLAGLVLSGTPIWSLPMPPPEPSGTVGFEGLLGYVARHPLACARLGAARVAAQLAHVRPFYSRAHNVAIALILAPLYALAAMTLVQRWREPLVRLLAAVVTVQLAIVGLTWADPDGRFLLYVLPLLAALAAAQAARWWPAGPGSAAPEGGSGDGSSTAVARTSRRESRSPTSTGNMATTCN